jgi:beta-lactamase class C
VVASLAIAAMIPSPAALAQTDAEIRDLVAQQIQPMLPAAEPQTGKAPGGVAVAVHVDGRTLFYNFGNAAPGRPVTSDSLFNLASIGKVFVSTLLAQAVKQGDVALDDPVSKYVTELKRGGDIKRVTLGQLASHTSGLTSTPQQVETWHRGQYTLPDFIRYLNAWQADAGHEPGKQFIYSNAGFALLWLALQRRYDTPIAALQDQRLTRPLGMTSTALPVPGKNSRGEIAPALRRRAVQGYGAGGQPLGAPGDEQGTFNWPGTGQMYSSARDMAKFLAANLGALPDNRPLQAAMAFAQQEAMFSQNPRFTQALGWGIVRNGDLTIVDKNGGMNNTSTYIGMMPQRELGVVILANRGGQPATRIGRQILRALARGPAVSQQGGN